MSKTLWERTVQLTVAFGERLLAPIERWIGRRSLVGDATFFPLERFPWVRHVEENWLTIREELERVLQDRAALPNFQDISTDQESITDDDRWKTFFFYGFGFRSDANCERCPETTRLIERVPGMTTAFFSILAPVSMSMRQFPSSGTVCAWSLKLKASVTSSRRKRSTRRSSSACVSTWARSRVRSAGVSRRRRSNSM